jgi:hypothetical protein
MLSRICQLLRRKQNGFDTSFDFSLCDTRGLRAYPKSRTRSQRLRNAKVRANVAKVNNKTIT